MPFNAVNDGEIIDIGGSSITSTFNVQLPKAFAGSGDFPKEVAYTTGMTKWFQIADQSYQTSDEMGIIKATAKEVVSGLPSGTKIIDLGAANSLKFAPYIEEFLDQGKTCVYVPLDINRESLSQQIDRAKNIFPTIKVVGLWGSFIQGDKYFDNISSTRLFLSLGSIFYNAPDDMCNDRCDQFVSHLGPTDRLIVGQDGPTGAEAAVSHQSYNTPYYADFFTTYLSGIQAHAGIQDDARASWTYESKMERTMHYFAVTATKDLKCQKYNNFIVKKGTVFTMFPSWKRGEQEIHEITKGRGLSIKTLGKAKGSGMRQFLIQKLE